MNVAATFLADDLGASERAVGLKEKWGEAIGGGSGGFVGVPLTLLRLQSQLGLTATDLVVLINLLVHWWDPKKAVFPRTTTIAKRMDVNERTIQRSFDKLIKLGLASRGKDEKGRRTFQFDGLVTRLNKDLSLAKRLAGQESLDV